MTKPFEPEELQAKVKVYSDLCESEKKLQQLNDSLEEQVKIRTDQLMKKEDVTSSERIESEQIELIVAKHRNGPTGIIKLLFDEKRMKFNNFRN